MKTAGGLLRALDHNRSAVDIIGLASDIGGRVAGEKEDRPGDIFGLQDMMVRSMRVRASTAPDLRCV